MAAKISYLVLLILILLATSCSSQKTEVKVLNVSEFKSKIDSSNPDVVLIDVRTPKEVAQGKIGNSLHLDFYRDDFNSQLLAMDKEKTFLVYCGSGVRSNKAAELMLQSGFKNVFDLGGGIRAWAQAGEPID